MSSCPERKQETQRQKSMNISHLLRGSCQLHGFQEVMDRCKPVLLAGGTATSFCSWLVSAHKCHLLLSKMLSNFSLQSGLIPPHARKKTSVSKVVKNITTFYIASPLCSRWVEQGKLYFLFSTVFIFKKRRREIQLPPHCSPASHQKALDLNPRKLLTPFWGRESKSWLQWMVLQQRLVKIHVCIAILSWEVPVHNSST